MSEAAFATLLFSAAGLVFVALGLPLYGGRVRPNAWYGCRTAKTLSDEKAWYAVNRVAGRDLTIGGAALVAVSLLMFAFARGLGATAYTLVLLATLVISVAVMAFDSARASRQL